MVSGLLMLIMVPKWRIANDNSSGAIAGIADQPLQIFMRPESDEDPSSPTGTATGFVSGVGKGLVGMVTKPIGGAAEFVSQTSMGLLQQVGLVEFSQAKHRPMDWPVDMFANAIVKYQV